MFVVSVARPLVSRQISSLTAANTQDLNRLRATTAPERSNARFDIWTLITSALMLLLLLPPMHTMRA